MVQEIVNATTETIQPTINNDLLHGVAHVAGLDQMFNDNGRLAIDLHLFRLVYSWQRIRSGAIIAAGRMKSLVPASLSGTAKFLVHDICWHAKKEKREVKKNEKENYQNETTNKQMNSV